MAFPLSTRHWLWAVKDGAEQESFWAMHNHLLAHPRLAMSLLLPPSRHRWIAVKSASHQNVMELCINLSTIHHPLEIELVPVEDCVAWLDWQPMMMSLPQWVWIKGSSKLQQLDADPDLLKYVGDLAWVKGDENYEATICLIPCLHVKVEREGKKPWIKRLPWLCHPKAIGEWEETANFTRQMDPEVWWCPDHPHKLEPRTWNTLVGQSQKCRWPLLAVRYIWCSSRPTANNWCSTDIKRAEGIFRRNGCWQGWIGLQSSLHGMHTMDIWIPYGSSSWTWP